MYFCCLHPPIHQQDFGRKYAEIHHLKTTTTPSSTFIRSLRMKSTCLGGSGQSSHVSHVTLEVSGFFKGYLSLATLENEMNDWNPDVFTRKRHGKSCEANLHHFFLPMWITILTNHDFLDMFLGKSPRNIMKPNLLFHPEVHLWKFLPDSDVRK